MKGSEQKRVRDRSIVQGTVRAGVPAAGGGPQHDVVVETLLVSIVVALHAAPQIEKVMVYLIVARSVVVVHAEASAVCKAGAALRSFAGGQVSRECGDPYSWR